MVWDTGHEAVHKNRNFTHLDDQFDQYMFVLRISIFEMTALISCTSNTMLDINRPYIGGERRFGISVATALVMQQSTASTENLHTFLADDQFDLYMFVLRISIF